jgi:glyoxylase-like metal-dependent hydrolase (beta-lactamase superfamily II)
MALYFDSLERLLALDLAVIYPAHGPRIDRPYDKIREYLAHRRMRESQVLECLAAGVAAIPAMVERMYTETPVFLHAAAAQSVRAHLVKLEREGAVRRVPDDRWALV